MPEQPKGHARWPSELPEAAPAETPPDDLTGAPPAAHDSEAIRMARILVVDDSPTIRKLVSGILTRHAHDATTAPDGPSALDRMRRETFDLVLLDIVMPRMDGYQLCREIKADEKLAHLPLVLMSANEEKIRGELFASTGAVDAITKPFQARALLAVVESALRRGNGDTVISVESTAIDEIPVSDVHINVSDMDLRDSATTLVKAHRSNLELISEATERLSASFASALAELPEGKRGDPAEIARIVSRTLAAPSGEVAVALERLGLGAAASDGFSGSIDLIPLAEILQVLQLQRQTGTCKIISRQGVEIEVWFRDGLVDLARGRGASDEFRLGRYFVEEGLLTRGGLDNILKGRAGVAKGRLGETLIQFGLITREDLRRALIRQTSELMYEALRWREGRFAFSHSVVAEPEAIRLGLPVASIVMEGFRRVDEWRLIEESIPFEDVLLRDQVALDALGWQKLSRQEQLLLEAIDGHRTVREILRAVDIGSFDACKTLYQFLQARLVRRRAA
jgi:CheY-like chemotaxis protein